jgi:hypothetical protein
MAARHRNTLVACHDCGPGMSLRSGGVAPGGQGNGVPTAGLSVRHAVAVALRRPDRRSAAEQQTRQAVHALHPELHQVFSLLEEFGALLRERPVQAAAELTAWEKKASGGVVSILTIRVLGCS